MKEVTYFSGYGEDRKEVGKLNVKERIGLVEQGTAATLIADGLFEDDEYCPYKYNFAFWYWMLHEYTDFDLSIDMDALMEIIETTNIAQEVRNAISEHQFENVENSVHELVEMRLNKSEFDKLCANANRLLNKYDEQLSTFFNSKKGKLILGNLAKVKFNEQDLVNAILASQKKETDLKS